MLVLLFIHCFFCSFWIKNAYDLVKQMFSGRIAYILWWNTRENNTHFVFLWLVQTYNHSLHSMAHTGFKQLKPVFQVKRLNIPLEKKLTAKTDWGEIEFCLLPSMEPFFFFNLALSFKQNENLDLYLEKISLPRFIFLFNCRSELPL